MKKIILSIFLLFTLAYTDSLTPTISSDSEVGKWRSFFGVEGGVGFLETTPAFLSINPFFLNNASLRGLSYGGGILGGWQKYTSEKIGMRNTLGLRVFVAPETKILRNQSFLGKTDFTRSTNDLITEIAFYYALDGLFDFVKNGNNRFGISFGFSTEIIKINFGRAFGFGYLLKLAPRLGFYTQFENNIVDLIISIPLLGGDGGDTTYNSTLTLGYKHLF
ncbi:Uncharacterised protein [Helicobacter cholecystus]|uniref:hypothetical protein n=1 Tax=Helicobacter cholecystus TaxID=45498 RepID=UPI000CF12F5F|nr:hypothetical protein [Helicobacter cholecystus]VEJ24738.1 Uncharacterised protein [Helicobacter cholecystus]